MIKGITDLSRSTNSWTVISTCPPLKVEVHDQLTLILHREKRHVNSFSSVDEMISAIVEMDLQHEILVRKILIENGIFEDFDIENNLSYGHEIIHIDDLAVENLSPESIRKEIQIRKSSMR